jgi:methylitaconate Delta-isomerase
LPTGHSIDRLDVAGVGAIDVSLVDIGNAHVFVRASDLGLVGTETAAEIDGDAALTRRLEAIRGAAAYRMKMISSPERSREESPATPLLAMISPPADYRNVIARTIVRADESDLVSRLMFMQRMHKTYAGTSTVCTGVAARLPGTIVHEMTRRESSDCDEVRIGHPAGIIATQTSVERSGEGYVVRRATLGRTARRILEGVVYVPDTGCS